MKNICPIWHFVSLHLRNNLSLMKTALLSEATLVLFAPSQPVIGPPGKLPLYWLKSRMPMSRGSEASLIPLLSLQLVQGSEADYYFKHLFLDSISSLSELAPDHSLLRAVCSISIQIRKSKQSFQKTYPSELSGHTPQRLWLTFLRIWQVLCFFVLVSPRITAIIWLTQTQGHPQFVFQTDWLNSILQTDEKVC